MGLPEIGWRFAQISKSRLARLGFGIIRNVPEPRFSEASSALFINTPPPTPELKRSVTDAADKVLAGHWDIFALRGSFLGFPPDWNRDPRTGTSAPQVFGPSIDYRDEKVVGDIKYLWEPNRHLELVALAQAFALTKDGKYLDAIGTLLTSWFSQCPYPYGVNWTSSLELGVRLLNWSIAWQLIGGPSSPLFHGVSGEKLRLDWLECIYRHAHFIKGHLSAHSSANNHLFGEYMGLYIASATWPYWDDLASWGTNAKLGLEEEAIKQNHPDGVNKEQAVYYQHEVMDMMLLTALAGRANKDPFSRRYLNQLRALADFLDSLMDVGGNMPMQGDADDAQMARLDHSSGSSPYHSLLASLAILFNDSRLKYKAFRLDDKSRWLFGESAERSWSSIPDAPRAEKPKLAYPHGGHYLLGSGFDTSKEVRIAIDCAPLGYLAIAAHGHADALAFTMSLSGREFLIDPGTYAYHTQKAWRDYFRATNAHNTVRVDFTDQSEIAGNFMWLAKANARMIRHEPDGLVQVFIGEHDGYSRLPHPLTHRREIRYHEAKSMIEVFDTLESKEGHDIEICWQWSESVQVEHESERAVKASDGNASMVVACQDRRFSAKNFRGSESPISGWVSRRFDQKTPTFTTVFTGRIEGTTTVKTHIVFNVAH